MRYSLVATILPLVLLTGCMSVPPHRCKLGEYNPDCHTMNDVYQQAIHTPASHASSMEQVMKPDAAHPANKTAPAAPLPNHGQAYAEPGQTGQPVFKEPTVHRVWIAPYVDGDGNLRSGEYTYFSTPGEWSYGSLRQPGAAGGSTLFAPTKGGQLGFTPKVPAPAAQPPKPDAPSAAAVQSPSLPAITQPAQKLNE